MGVKQKRIQAAACYVAQRRQRLAFDYCLDKSAVAIRGEGRIVHITAGHMWDEVEVKQAWRPSEAYRILKKNVAMPTLVQRTTISVALGDLQRGLCNQFQTYWLSQPSEVCGTKAHDLHPGIVKHMPANLNLTDAAIMRDTLSKVSSMTFMPMCDRASSNMSILRMWGSAEQKLKDELGELGNRLLYFPDTCGIHSHHRGKIS
eukprot:9489586-Pyramimonas_sp.AAC.1